MRYTNFLPAPSASPGALLASIARIDTALCRDVMRWCLRPAQRGAGADFKPGKYQYYIDLIGRNAALEMPEFYLINGRADIMDGRHRIYALHDRGYTQVMVCCKLADRAGLLAQIG